MPTDKKDISLKEFASLFDQRGNTSPAIEWLKKKATGAINEELDIVGILKKARDWIEQESRRYAETVPVKHRAAARHWAKQWELLDIGNNQMMLRNNHPMGEEFELGYRDIPPSYVQDRAFEKFNLPKQGDVF